MDRVRISVKLIEQVRTRGLDQGQFFVRDSELIGFGLRVNKLRVSFIVERRVGKTGPVRRVDIGDSQLVALDEARRQAREVISKLANGIDLSLAEPACKVPTLRTVIADYIDERNLKASTKKSYAYWSTRWLGDWLDKKITDITESMIVERNAGLNLPPTKWIAPNRTTGKTLMCKIMTMLSGFLTFAKHRYKNDDGSKILVHNPCDILTETRTNHKIPTKRNFVSASQMPGYFAAVAESDRLTRAFYLFLTYSGFRCAEATDLEWREVDLANGVINLPGHRTKTNTSRSIPITRQIRVILEAQREDQQGLEFKYVFATHPNRHIHKNHLAKVIKPIREKSGIADLSNHGLRRSYITHAKNHMDFNDRKLLVGHALDITGKYDQTTTDDLKIPAQRAADHITTLMTGSIDLPSDLFSDTSALVAVCA